MFVIAVKPFESSRNFPSIYVSLHILRMPNFSIPLSHLRSLTWVQYYLIYMRAHVSPAVTTMSFYLLLLMSIQNPTRDRSEAETLSWSLFLSATLRSLASTRLWINICWINDWMIQSVRESFSSLSGCTTWSKNNHHNFWEAIAIA